MKQALNCSGSKRPKTRTKVSWEGRLPGSFKNRANQSCLALPNSSISTQLSAPKTTAQRDDDDVQESMTLGPVDSRVLEVSKVPRQQSRSIL